MKQHTMSTVANKIKVILAVVAIAISMNSSVCAQGTALKSRVAVVTNEVKTNIWVSDFPKNTSVVIYDGENNLISITTTNNYGAAFISLPKGVKSGVIVKTIDGEISASNKSVIKNRQEEQNMAANYQDDSNKA